MHVSIHYTKKSLFTPLLYYTQYRTPILRHISSCAYTYKKQISSCSHTEVLKFLPQSKSCSCQHEAYMLLSNSKPTPVSLLLHHPSSPPPFWDAQGSAHLLQVPVLFGFYYYLDANLLRSCFSLHASHYNQPVSFTSLMPTCIFVSLSLKITFHIDINIFLDWYESSIISDAPPHPLAQAWLLFFFFFFLKFSAFCSIQGYFILVTVTTGLLIVLSVKLPHKICIVKRTI